MTTARFEKGLETLRKLNPEVAQTLMDNLREVLPELATMTIEFGFGEIMSRPGLDLRTRELLNIAMLGVIGNAPSQLEMHVRGALNTGATQTEVTEVVLQIAAYAGFPAAYNTLQAVHRVFRSDGDPQGNFWKS